MTELLNSHVLKLLETGSVYSPYINLDVESRQNGDRESYWDWGTCKHPLLPTVCSTDCSEMTCSTYSLTENFATDSEGLCVPRLNISSRVKPVRLTIPMDTTFLTLEKLWCMLLSTLCRHDVAGSSSNDCLPGSDGTNSCTICGKCGNASTIHATYT